MKQLYFLFWADYKASRQWFIAQTLSKLMVMVGFLGIAILITSVLFAVGNIFFRNIAFYPIYGNLAASYVIHASVLLLLWVILGTSVFSYMTLIRIPGKHIEYLLSLPVSSSALVAWLFLKSYVVNVLLFSVFFIPLFYAYRTAFFQEIEPQQWVLFGMAVFLFTLAIHSIGGIIAFLTATYTRRNGMVAATIGMSVFLLGAYGMLQVIFPTELLQLYTAPIEQVVPLYNQLPLSQPFLPTYWLTQGLVQTHMAFLLPWVGIAGTLAFGSILLQTYRLSRVIQQAKMQSGKVTHYINFAAISQPLVYKDILSILRNPSEVGYGVFLIALAGLFFLFLHQGILGRSSYRQAQETILLFTFVWLCFFTTAYLLRLVFPLMAREGKSKWYLFSLPLSFDAIVRAKVKVGLLLVIPHLLAGATLWFFLPFAAQSVVVLLFISVTTIVLLTVTTVLLGSLFPNFSAAESAERVSTSMMGVVSLFVSLAMTILAARLVYEYQLKLQSPEIIIGFLSMFLLLTLAVLFFLTHIMSSSYRA